MDFAKLANPQILRIKPYVPGRLIEEDILKLASNENLLGPPESVVRALCEHATMVNYYPDSDCQEVRQALADHWGITPEEIIMGNGAVEHIYNVCTAFISPGEKVMFPWPSFAIFHIAATIQDAHLEMVPLTPDFQFDFDLLIQRYREFSPKLIFLNNPNNPTGSWFSEQELVRLLEAVDPEHTLIFLDEAYVQFVDAADFPDSLKLRREFPNLVILRTFAKIYGLAGLRIGALIGPPQFIDLINRVRDPFNVNRLAQVALLAALKDEAYYQKSRELVIRDRNYLMQKFDERGIRYVPTQTNFLFFDSGVDGEELFRRMMEEEKITMRPMTGYGLPSWFRASVPSDLAQCDRFLEALERQRTRLIEEGLAVG